MTEILSKNPVSLPQFLVSQTSTHPETGFLRETRFLYPEEPRWGSESDFDNIFVFLSSLQAKVTGKVINSKEV
ncbi:MAG: hypothetical protein EA395_13265 [Phormidium sp. GEM2.Bin31]|nr:MAG: hypothetical protein EA395_13265 [Phormidium sp. GEM2.Bin31]